MSEEDDEGEFAVWEGYLGRRWGFRSFLGDWLDVFLGDVFPGGEFASALGLRVGHHVFRAPLKREFLNICSRLFLCRNETESELGEDEIGGLLRSGMRGRRSVSRVSDDEVIGLSWEAKACLT